MKQKTLKEIYVYSMLLLAFLILCMQLFHFRLLMASARKNSLETISFISAQLTKELQEEVSFLEHTASSFSSDSYISRFLLEENAANRYQDNINIYKQMQGTLKEHPTLASVFIYDQQEHCYQYGEFFSLDICKELYQATRQFPSSSYLFQTIQDTTYLIAYVPIYRSKMVPLTQIGWAILLSRCDSMQRCLDSYAAINGLSVMLLNADQQVSLSNRRELLGIEYSASLAKEGTLALSEQLLSPSQIRLCILQDNSKLLPYQSLFITNTLLLLLILFLVLIAVSKLINHMVFHPIDYMITILSSLGSQGAKGRVVFQPHIYQSLQIVKLAQTINQMLSRIDDFSHRAFLNQQRLYEAALKEAKYKTYLLRKQIDAHFIFNTLNSIKILSDRYQTEDISQMTEGLGTIMRYAYLPTDYINLFDEFQILEQYVYIMNIRYNHCFLVEYDVEDVLCNYRILRQLLQPILENCMTHAVISSGEPLSVTIRARIVEENRILLEITDNGIGIPPDKLAKIRLQLYDNEEHYDTKGISLVNIHKRLQLYYGTEFQLHIESQEGVYTCVSFSIPLQKDKPDGS